MKLQRKSKNNAYASIGLQFLSKNTLYLKIPVIKCDNRREKVQYIDNVKGIDDIKAI